jgi:hypothetical protein
VLLIKIARSLLATCCVRLGKQGESIPDEVDNEWRKSADYKEFESYWAEVMPELKVRGRCPMRLLRHRGVQLRKDKNVFRPPSESAVPSPELV